MSQLTKTQEENKHLNAKVTELQAVLAHYSCENYKKEESKEYERTKSVGKSAGKSGEKRRTE